MAARPARRTRVMLRCVREDLGLELPPVEVDLGSLDHPLVAEARRLAPAAPRGQKRILSIDHPLVYRLRHGRWRGATWLEVDDGRCWLCAGARREDGSGDDAYEVFAALHRADRLLPGADDYLRDALERNARIIDDATAAIPEALANALARPGRDVAARLGDLVDARLHASVAGEEIWVAVATQAADGRFVEERLRDVLFRLAFDAADAELWDPRRDSTDARNVVLADARRVCERGRLATEKRLTCVIHAACELFAMAVDVLVDRPLDEFGLPKPRHQRGVADLLLCRLMNLNGRLSTCHSVPRYRD